jgi:radical SAM superfamily enzyme YgiQ (UPF0313 family)
MARSLRCLLVYPEFTTRSFWNFRAACEIFGAKYPAPPLGLITVAALLPSDWEARLVDCNVEQLSDDDLGWADIVMTGGMLAQQPSTLAVIERAREVGKPVVVGGPDPTSSPHHYDRADYQVLGEAEITLPRWLADFSAGVAVHRYEPGEQRADAQKSPQPRFDLLKFDRYLYVGVQFARGCPFLCEFCDIIELFGRVPRLKTPEQMLGELERLYQLGHRGHVDFVDDNFIGNKRDVKKFLPRLISWQEAHGWPFEFSTEASINLADDDELLGLMQAAGFCTVFTGIESPDETTLAHMQKKQNTRRSLAASIRKLYAHGMYVNTGYILGFDTEGPRAADGVLNLIEESATAVSMVGMLFALPGTQLSRRLAREGRLGANFDYVDSSDIGDHTLWGLNFTTVRPREEVMRGYRHVIAEIFKPEAYFGRVQRMSLELQCGAKKMRAPLRRWLKDMIGAARLIWRQGVLAPHRHLFWRTYARIMRQNPAAVRYAAILTAQYDHFGPFHKLLLADLDRAIAAVETRGNRADLSTPPLGVELTIAADSRLARSST